MAVVVLAYSELLGTALSAGDDMSLCCFQEPMERRERNGNMTSYKPGRVSGKASVFLRLMQTFSAGFPEPDLKAAWVCIKLYHTAKPARK